MSRHNKRKIKASTAFFMVCVFVVTIGLGMYIAFGMNVQRASGAVSVEYSANNVHATVSAYYQICGDNTTYAMTSGGETSTTFTASQNTTTATFSAGNISLSSDRTYILFTFTFTNLAPRNDVSQGYDVKVTLHDNCTKTNISTYYMATSTTPTGMLASNYATMSTQGLTSGLDSFYVPAQRTMYVKILAEITDLDYSATYSSSGANKLSWDLDHVDYLDGCDINNWVVNENHVATAYNGTDVNIVVPSTATKIAASAFENNSTIKSVVIPSSVTDVGNNAFYNCTALESVVFEGTSETGVALGQYSFCYCTSLTEVTLPNNLAPLECGGAFEACYSITSITIPASCTKIQSFTFSGCRNLREIIFLGDITEIARYAFQNCRFTTIDLPNSLTYIGDNVFRNCSSLVSINFPNSLIDIRNNAFNGCSSLATAYFGNPNGWATYDSNTSSYSNNLSSSNLSNPSTAAAYLKNTYVNVNWHRSVS